MFSAFGENFLLLHTCVKVQNALTRIYCMQFLKCYEIITFYIRRALSIFGSKIIKNYLALTKWIVYVLNCIPIYSTHC